MIHENSKESLEGQRKKGKTQHFRLAVFNALKASDEPMTDRQLFELLNEDDVNNVRPEITRLKQDGLIEEVDKVKCPVSGKTVRRTAVTGRDYFTKGRSKKRGPSPLLDQIIKQQEREITRLKSELQQCRAERGLLL